VLVSVCLSVCLSRFPVALYAQPENLLYASSDPKSPDYNTIKVADFGLSKFVSENAQMKTTCGTVRGSCAWQTPTMTIDMSMTVRLVAFSCARWLAPLPIENLTLRLHERLHVMWHGWACVCVCGVQPGYVAPEVLDPYLPFTNGYGPEVDLWSLGVVLYIMLCGFPPFYDDSTAVLFKQIRKGEYAFPSPYWDGVSDEAKDLVAKVLVVDAGKRYTAQQCLDHPWITNAGEASAKKLHSGHRAFLLIRKLPIFDNIDPACLQQVTAMLKVVKVETGKPVIQAGEVGDCMYFINSGTVQVFVNGNEVDRLTTGDFFGEVALTVSKQRTADVKSLGNSKGQPVELFQLMRSDFEAVMERFPILKTRLAQIGQVLLHAAIVWHGCPRVHWTAVPMKRRPGVI
jgi:hypothetical protein